MYHFPSYLFVYRQAIPQFYIWFIYFSRDEWFHDLFWLRVEDWKKILSYGVCCHNIFFNPQLMIRNCFFSFFSPFLWYESANSARRNAYLLNSKILKSCMNEFFSHKWSKWRAMTYFIKRIFKRHLQSYVVLLIGDFMNDKCYINSWVWDLLKSILNHNFWDNSYKCGSSLIVF